MNARALDPASASAGRGRGGNAGPGRGASSGSGRGGTVDGTGGNAAGPGEPGRSERLLQVKDLSVRYNVEGGEARAVDGVSFEVPPARAVGLVGESGCGKTTVAKTLLRLLPRNAEVTSGRVLIDGSDTLALPPDAFRRLRWTRIAYIPQNALSALNPVYRVGDQLAEPLKVHGRLSGSNARERVTHALEKVNLAPSVARAFPHQLSGGMRQRVLIAMALVLEPPLVIVDEPTTALDVLTQLEVLKEFKRVREHTSSSFLYVSHDLGIVKELCDEVLVMYAGRLVERGPASHVFKAPAHPFTMGLLYAVPQARGAAQLVSIPGATPDLRQPMVGCAFAARCPFATDRCRTETPRLRAVAEGQAAACHYLEDAPRFRREARFMTTWEAVRGRATAGGCPGDRAPLPGHDVGAVPGNAPDEAPRGGS